MFTGHEALIADRERNRKYQEAIRETIKPGSVVVDLGAGTGILGFFACQAGAKRVYAIEAGQVIEIAKEIARANGFEQRMVFIKAISTQVNLPEKTDFIVSELIGNFVLEENLLQFLYDARKRFLKRKGKLIPQSVKLWLAPVEASGIHRKISLCRKGLYKINLSRLREISLNNPHTYPLRPRMLLCNPVFLKEIDFQKGKARDLWLDEIILFRVKRTGLLHGIGGWFDLNLSEKVVLSTSPDSPLTHWAQTFFPLARPLKIKKGNTVRVRVAAYPHQGRTCWNWTVEYKKGRIEHSTLHSALLSRKDLLRRSTEFKPHISDPGAIEMFILNHFDGKRKLEDIAKELREKYPHLYPSRARALARVGLTVRRYAR